VDVPPDDTVETDSPHASAEPTTPASSSAAELSLQGFVLPRYDSLPSFGIYIDQLVSFVNDAVGLLATHDEKPLTAAMVNNYVKQGAMPRPEKKKYGRNHIAYVIVICILKKVFSIQEITQLIQLQKSFYDSGPAYDAFVDSLEENLAQLFSNESVLADTAATSFDGELLVQRGVITFSNKLFIQMMLDSRPAGEDQAQSIPKKPKSKKPQ